MATSENEANLGAPLGSAENPILVPDETTKTVPSSGKPEQCTLSGSNQPHATNQLPNAMPTIGLLQQNLDVTRRYSGATGIQGTSFGGSNGTPGNATPTEIPAAANAAGICNNPTCMGLRRMHAVLSVENSNVQAGMAAVIAELRSCQASAAFLAKNLDKIATNVARLSFKLDKGWAGGTSGPEVPAKKKRTTLNEDTNT